MNILMKFRIHNDVIFDLAYEIFHIHTQKYRNHHQSKFEIRKLHIYIYTICELRAEF